MLYTMSHLCSLGGMAPEAAIAAATGNNARVYRLNSGILAPGKDADVILLDACAGGACDDALSALRNGDIPAVGAVVTDGVPRFVGRSRNTPGTTRTVRVARCVLPMDFSAAAH
jgi:enamidase